ncbi:MarR family transcriptional regulator [Pararoseomonas sp. SCSIO 73927]|uniref:MarR family winged helix-turn-helix transcriptional regulator n=1 Tax=Pararoseomonas sp. SCSIO 73927 TaxID=3114537 RepID=UPI0030D348F3
MAASGTQPKARAGRSRGGKKAPAGRFDLLDHPMFFLAHILTRFDGNVVVDLRRHGFSQSDWRLISTLQYSDDLTLTELARITTLERSFVGRVAGSLEERGLVRRKLPEDDRRTTRVSLTEAGRRSFAEVLLPTTAAQIDNAFRDVGPEDRATLFRVLRQMMRNVYDVARETTPILDGGPAASGDP